MNRTVPGRVERTRRDIVLLAFGAGVIAALQVGKVPPALPQLRADLGLGLVEGGWLVSLLHLFSALFGILIGMATDRLGSARMMIVAVAVMAAGSALGAVSGNVTMLFAGRALEGAGFAGATISGPVLMAAAAVPRDRSLVLGMWATYFPVGIALGIVAAPPLIESLGWRGLWLAHMAVCLCYMLLLLWRLAPGRLPVMPGGGAEGKARGFGAVRPVLRLPGPYLFALSFFLYACGIFALMTWMPTWLIETRGYTLGKAALIGAAVVLVNAFGNLGAAWVMHRQVPFWAVIAGSFVAMIVTAWFIFAGDAPDSLRIPAALAMSAFTGMLPAACFAGAAAHARGSGAGASGAGSSGEVAITSGVVLHGANLGNLLAAPFFAVAVTFAGGWSSGHLPMLALGIAGLLVAGVLYRVERRRFAASG